MLKGLTEARRQLIMSYPSKEDITESEWTAEIIDWAERGYAKLVSLGPLREQRELAKPPPANTHSLTETEMEALKKTILRCTDLRQLKDLQQLFFVHLRSLVSKFRPGRFR